MKQITNEERAVIAALYIGSPVQDNLSKRKDGVLVGLVTTQNEALIKYPHTNTIFERTFEEIQLILRRITDLTDMEKYEWYNMFSSGKNIRSKEKVFAVNTWIDMYADKKQLCPAEFRYLLSIGIDLFGLIESGIAIPQSDVK